MRIIGIDAAVLATGFASYSTFSNKPLMGDWATWTIRAKSLDDLLVNHPPVDYGRLYDVAIIETPHQKWAETATKLAIACGFFAVKVGATKTIFKRAGDWQRQLVGGDNRKKIEDYVNREVPGIAKNEHELDAIGLILWYLNWEKDK